jgi:hypothetical protein
MRTWYMIMMSVGGFVSSVKLANLIIDQKRIIKLFARKFNSIIFGNKGKYYVRLAANRLTNGPSPLRFFHDVNDCDNFEMTSNFIAIANVEFIAIQTA